LETKAEQKNIQYMKILCTVGTRPNFIKIAPLLDEFKKYPKFKPILVHTGQHYDYEMSEVFFKDLNIPKPDYNLGIGSGSHAEQTGKIIIEFEKVCLKEKPDLVVVVGDVNSTLAAALVAAKLGIKVAHIEAGLRSFDRAMPEEINRRLTDHISDFLFVTEPSGLKNLLNEGVARDKIFFTGDIMIDTLINAKNKIAKSKIIEKYNLKKNNYAVLTLHRPSNVDDKKKFVKLINILNKVDKRVQTIFPVHPRTKKQLPKNIGAFCIPPLGYLDFIALISRAKFVLTDSGGVQKETTFLKIPCLILRENTEQPITIIKGSSILCGTDKNKILNTVNQILSSKYKKSGIPKYWDGETAKRILKILSLKF